jgi:hypothetical protein
VTLAAWGAFAQADSDELPRIDTHDNLEHAGRLKDGVLSLSVWAGMVSGIPRAKRGGKACRGVRRRGEAAVNSLAAHSRDGRNRCPSRRPKRTRAADASLRYLVILPDSCERGGITEGQAALLVVFTPLPASNCGAFLSFAFPDSILVRFLTISSTPAIPEPGTLTLLGLGLIGLGLTRRRRAN